MYNNVLNGILAKTSKRAQREEAGVGGQKTYKYQRTIPPPVTRFRKRRRVIEEYEESEVSRPIRSMAMKGLLECYSWVIKALSG